jgi:hypothetical protein
MGRISYEDQELQIVRADCERWSEADEAEAEWALETVREERREGRKPGNWWWRLWP